MGCQGRDRGWRGGRWCGIGGRWRGIGGRRFRGRSRGGHRWRRFRRGGKRCRRCGLGDRCNRGNRVRCHHRRQCGCGRGCCHRRRRCQRDECGNAGAAQHRRSRPDHALAEFFASRRGTWRRPGPEGRSAPGRVELEYPCNRHSRGLPAAWRPGAASRSKGGWQPRRFLHTSDFWITCSCLRWLDGSRCSWFRCLRGWLRFSAQCAPNSPARPERPPGSRFRLRRRELFNGF